MLGVGLLGAELVAAVLGGVCDALDEDHAVHCRARKRQRHVVEHAQVAVRVCHRGALRQDGCRLRLSLGVAEDGILDVKRLEIAQRHEILSCKSTSARPSAA